MEKNKISIIIPVYKVEKYLNRCVESITSQSYQNLEIILVDDGSPDACPQMCDEWAKKDGRVKVIHKQNGGVSSARNEGIKKATGDYISFIDSDDYVDGAFSKFVKIALQANCDVCYSFLDGVSKHKKDLKFANVTNKDIQYFVKNNYPISCFGRLYKRTFIVGNDLFFGNTTNAEDQEWSTRIYCKVKSVYVSTISFYNYSQTENSASKSMKFKNFESIYLNVEKIFADADNSFLNSKTKKLIKSNASNLLYYLIARFGRFDGEKKQYFNLMTKNKKIFIKPKGFKYFMIYLMVKIFGVKKVMKICSKIFK